MKGFWHLCAGVIGWGHWWWLVAAGVATLVLGLGIPRLQFSTGQDTVVSSSQVYPQEFRPAK